MFTTQRIPDPYELQWIERTGYPSWNQPPEDEDEEVFFCDRCGEEIEDVIYTDDGYESLCAECVLILHEKE